MNHAKILIAALAALTAAPCLASCGDSSAVLTENNLEEAITASAVAVTDETALQTAETDALTSAATELTKSDNNARQTSTEAQTTAPEAETKPENSESNENGTLQYYAASYYAARTNHFPEFVDVEDKEDGTVSLHLYDLIDNHAATCDWYYVDRHTLKGKNFVGDEINLKENQPKLWAPGGDAYTLVPNGYYGAVLYLGTLDRSNLSSDIITEMKSFVDSSEYAQQYPFLKDIPKDLNYFATDLGTEIWMILPKNDMGWITVRAIEPDTVKYRITQTCNSAPIILCCNYSDIGPDADVQITYTNEDRGQFSPYISLKDGRPTTTDEEHIAVLN